MDRYSLWETWLIQLVPENNLMVKRRRKARIRQMLLDKSRDSFILALETINRLSLEYRVESFLILMCNSWELLLKAKIVTDQKKRSSIYYKKNRNQPRKTISLKECVKRVFANEKDPIAANILALSELRDACVHYFIKDVTREIIGLFQASAINFNSLLQQWFRTPVTDRVSVGMMAIVYDFDPDEFDISSPIMKKQLTKEQFRYLSGFQAKLLDSTGGLSGDPRFVVPVTYKLALTKNPDDADITLSHGASTKNAIIVHSPKDSAKTHPIRLKDVRKKLENVLRGKVELNQYDFLAINAVYEIKKKTEFYYKSDFPGSQSQYSESYVDWIVKQYTKDSNFFSKTKQKYKEISKIGKQNIQR